ncbi:MAG TPA: sugar nucleotide-binding protein, partial [Azospirillaceae bacterium]|nr:sugar nucleotide-binding protein [Azospirillaceae bacterium]
IIGVNHYLTSERFLDERLERYPPQTHGGNGRDRYADVEAVRVVAEGPAGPERLLLEAWERYGIPLAVTEVHNGCTHDEQLRWFQEVWDAAERLSRRGVDIRAVTAWALLGSCDWNCLVTRCAGHYEPGVFDIRGQRPRATAIGRLMRDLAQQGTADHPVLDVPGWWCRPDRLAYPPVSCGLAPASPPRAAKAPRPLLITGANGTLGRAFARLCDQRGLPFHLLTRVQFDIADPRSVADGLARYRPWAVINAAGFVRVDEAERMPAPCRRDNSRGPAVLAHACGRAEVALLSFSSDLVFDGAKREPYLERDTVAPLSIYGLTKAEAEAAILEAMPHALIVRTSAFFGPWDEHNFIAQALQALEARRSLRAAADVTVSPTYVPDLVHACLDLLIDGESGLWHLASMGAVSWADLAREAATRAGLNAKLVEAVPSSALGWTARRPVYSVLGSGRGALMPGLDDALGRYFAAR